MVVKASRRIPDGVLPSDACRPAWNSVEPCRPVLFFLCSPGMLVSMTGQDLELNADELHAAILEGILANLARDMRRERIPASVATRVLREILDTGRPGVALLLAILGENLPDEAGKRVDIIMDTIGVSDYGTSG